MLAKELSLKTLCQGKRCGRIDIKCDRCHHHQILTTSFGDRTGEIVTVLGCRTWAESLLSCGCGRQ